MTMTIEASWWERLARLVWGPMEQAEPEVTVIGFGYTRRVGKDYAAQVVVDHYGQRPGLVVARYAFAQEVKRGLAQALSHLGLDAFTAEAGEKELIRPLLVAYGELGRAVEPGHWIRSVDDQLRQDAARARARGLRLVALVTDVRYRNEAEWIKSWSGHLLEVRGSAEPNETEARHSGECRGLSDAVVENDGGEGFRSRVLAAVEGWI